MAETTEVQKKISLLDYWGVIRARIWVVILPVIVIATTVLIQSLLKDPVYESKASLRVRDAEKRPYLNPLEVNLPTEVEVIRSKSVLYDVINKLETEEKFRKYRDLKHFKADLYYLKNNIGAKRMGQEVNIIEVSAKSHDPGLSRDITNTLMKMAIEYNLAFKKREAQQTRDYIDEQRLVVSENLREAELKLYEFHKKHKTVDMKVQIERQVVDPLTIVDPLARVESEIMPLREKVASLSKIYTNSYPELREAKAELEVYEKYRRELMEKIDSLPDKTFEYAKHLREAEIYRKDYETLSLAAQNARLKEVGVVSDYYIVDKASTPTVAIYPRPVRNVVIGTIVGFMLGIFLAFFLDYLDTSIKTADDVEKYLFIPLLGRIPHISLNSGQKSKKTLVAKKQDHKERERALQQFELTSLSERLITHFEPKDSVTEAYRQLYTNLSYSYPDGKLKTMVVTSSGPSEGKTSIGLNLAVIAASLGNRVLVIDVDLRKPMVHKLFILPQEPGLSNIVMDNTDLEKATKPSGVENLDIITCGHILPAPMLLLNSPKFQLLLETLRERYDLIIFDTAPINVAADTPILASKMDGVLMVIRQGDTEHMAATNALQLLENVHAKVIGAVMNSVSARPSYGFSYGGYYKYNYYHYHYQYSHEREGKRTLAARMTEWGSVQAGIVKQVGQKLKGFISRKAV